METSLKAVTKASKKGSQITWGEGVDDRVPSLGIQRYRAHERMRYPKRAEVLSAVNDFMTVFEQVAEARKREESRRMAEPDEDGFVTVTHGPKLNSVAREDEMKELVERQKKKAEGLEDFYRFQSREKRKERQNQLLRKFDEDKKKLAEIKARKGKIRVSFILWTFGWFVFPANASFLSSLSEDHIAYVGKVFWEVFFFFCRFLFPARSESKVFMYRKSELPRISFLHTSTLYTLFVSPMMSPLGPV